MCFMIREYAAFPLSKLKLNKLFSRPIEMEPEGWTERSAAWGTRGDLCGVSGCDSTLLNDTHAHILKPSADAKTQDVSLLAWT